MNLQEFFKRYPKAAIAFSGGVDSAYLLYAAMKYGKEIKAYYVKSEFQPQFEFEDAVALANMLGADMRTLSLEALSLPFVKENPVNRCYFCKKGIFGAIAQAAMEDGYHILLDGTNASDEESDRPGMRALKELSVLSPLRECGLTKTQIRSLSKEAGLFTWDKPAYACLATRIASGEIITAEKLSRTESAEKFLSSLGFVDFRIRSRENAAKIQLTAMDWPRMTEMRETVFKELKRYYQQVTLDLEVRK